MKNKFKFAGSVLLCLLIVLITYMNAFSFMEHRLQDALFQRPKGVGLRNIAIIMIDDETLDELGLPPEWGRQIWADAINILNSDEYGSPAIIALDMLFLSGGDTEADLNFAEAVEASGNVVVGAHAFIGDTMRTTDDGFKFIRDVVLEYRRPFPALADAACYGMVNGVLDDDGIKRNALLQYEFEGERIFSFPLEIFRRYNELFSDGEIPDFLYNNAEAYIPFYSGGAMPPFTTISFIDIFDEWFEPALFEDHVIFIGPYAAGLMDAYATPLGQMYGVEIHLNAFQMMRDGNFKEYTTPLVNALIVFATLAALIIFAQKADIRILLGVVVVFGVAYVFGAMFMFNTEPIGRILPLLYPLTSILILYVYELIYGYVLESIEKQKVKGVFKKYVDPKLVDKLIESGDMHTSEVGVKRHIAVLFVDVRGFTPMTEALKDEPETVVKILNEYLELTSSAVFNNGGSVDKFIGDATMALFNGFVPQEDYEFFAVKAAWEIVTGAAEVNASIKEKYNVDVGFGVGVNCGEAIVGNLGPSFRKDYTAIGDVVNTAARLESNAQRSQVLISGQLYEKLKDRVLAESIGAIPLKGKSEELEVFAVKGIL
jgi:adenylate cyclase